MSHCFFIIFAVRELRLFHFTPRRRSHRAGNECFGGGRSTGAKAQVILFGFSGTHRSRALLQSQALSRDEARFASSDVIGTTEVGPCYKGHASPPGLKPKFVSIGFIGTTEVVPCYKACILRAGRPPEFLSTFRGPKDSGSFRYFGLGKVSDIPGLKHETRPPGCMTYS